MLAGYIFLMAVRKPEAQPAPADDVDEIMQGLSWKDRGEDMRIRFKTALEPTSLEIDDTGLLAQVFASQGQDVDYLTGEVEHSEPASSSHETPRSPLPFHGPNSPLRKKQKGERTTKKNSYRINLTLLLRPVTQKVRPGDGWKW